MELNGYELSRSWFDFCFENPEKIKPNHTAVYFFAIEHCNRLGWKEKFGFPSAMAMEAVGIKSYNTYINTLNDLVSWGFIKMVEKSKNQYSSNIIALSKFNKAHDKALDKALIKHGSKQSESTDQSTDQSIDSINKQRTKNKEQRTKNKDVKFNFKKSLIDLGVNEKIVDDWMLVRKNKKATNSETSFKRIKNQINISGLTANECIRNAVERDWKGFESSWLNNLGTNGKKHEINPDISKNPNRMKFSS